MWRPETTEQNGAYLKSQMSRNFLIVEIMKSLWIIIFITFSSMAYGQGMNIRWEDEDGREFSITAPSGSLSYGMIAGDHISYNMDGSVNKVGTVYISYNMDGTVRKVGSVYISYNMDGSVSKVGGLYIRYDFYGKVTGTSGSVY